MSAVRCGRCGILYHSRYEKCPRCRGRDPRPVDPRAAQQRAELSLGASRGAGRERRGAQAQGSRPAASKRAGPSGKRRRLADSAAVRVAGRGGLAGGAFAIAASALILLLTGWVWGPASSGSAVAAPSPSPTSASPLAALARAAQPRRVTVVQRVPSELPFVEPGTEGRLAYASGDLERALRSFEEQIASRPSDAESHSNAGQVLVRLGRPAEALPFFRKAVALDENRWAYRFNLARCHGLLGDWQQAAVEYAGAERLFPGDYATLFNLAQALHRAGQEEAAVGRYRQAIAQKPDEASFHLALGISEDRLGHAGEAAAAYRRFLELSPEASEAAAVRQRAERLETAAPAASAGV